MSYTRKCAYCGTWFEAKRPHAVCCKDRCRTNAWEHDGFDAEQDALQRVEEHPLAEVRAEQEQAKEKGRWTLLIREHLSRTLLATGYVHADDFDSLSVPDQHRNCIGSQMGPFVQKGWMVEISRRPSANPRRKKAKSAVYELTAKGRTELQTLIGSCADTPGGVKVAESPASSHSVPHVGAASSQDNENVGLSAAAQPGGPVESGRSIESGDLTLTAGQVSGKRDKGRAHSSSAAGSETPDPEVLQLEIPQESGSSAYEVVVDGEAA